MRRGLMRWHWRKRWQIKGWHVMLSRSRHVSLLYLVAEADTMWAALDRAEEDRARRMPNEKVAVLALFEAWQRLTELGWKSGIHAPRDGTHCQSIELGSTGIFDCDCHGEWPNCTWTTYDERDAYPSSQAPALIKLYPEDQAKYDARMAEARERFAKLSSSDN